MVKVDDKVTVFVYLDESGGCRLGIKRMVIREDATGKMVTSYVAAGIRWEELEEAVAPEFPFVCAGQAVTIRSIAENDARGGGVRPLDPLP